MVTAAEAEVLETVLKHMRSKNDVEKTTSKKLWLVRRLKMDGFNASLCQTSWATSLGCPAGESLSLSLISYTLIFKAVTSLIFLLHICLD